jgi:hypothetical protein
LRPCRRDAIADRATQNEDKNSNNSRRTKPHIHDPQTVILFGAPYLRIDSPEPQRWAAMLEVQVAL